ncbi:MAG: cupin domain-containing protein [Dehalococcoidia bacterium]|nr:cupin domain-containing protein [Dehalococcoidia bacterium]
MAYTEPTGFTKAGNLWYPALATEYEKFVEEEGLPTLGGTGVRDIRDIELSPWKRMGGKGAYIQFDGTQGLFGMYVVEVPPGGALNAERHLYEEMFIAFEGRGTAEVWGNDEDKKLTFEWGQGSHFAMPPNAWHRLVNATSQPCLLLAITNAPPIMKFFPNRRFVFENDFVYPDSVDNAEHFKANEDMEPLPDSGRAMIRTNLIPDIIHTYLPNDNHRGPGSRRVVPVMSSINYMNGFITQFPNGRYAKGHWHAAGAVLICLTGRGYSFSWPRALGTHPWSDGHADKVMRQDYQPGGIVSASPGGVGNYHQHFSTGNEPLRMRAILGGLGGGGRVGKLVPGVGVNMDEGGSAIGLYAQDPELDQIFRRELEKTGTPYDMPAEGYEEQPDHPEIDGVTVGV